MSYEYAVVNAVLIVVGWLFFTRTEQLSEVLEQRRKATDFTYSTELSRVKSTYE